MAAKINNKKKEQGEVGTKEKKKEKRVGFFL